MKVMFLILAMIMASVAHSQALRIVGYEGELVFNDDLTPETITVRGATQQECDENFDAAQGSRDLFYGTRFGTQECVPLFVYRSPTAPSFSINPSVALWPKIPLPPVCLSCPVFDNPLMIKQLYPNHSAEVMSYVKKYNVDKYNQELKALNNQYIKRLESFERKMMALDDYLEYKQ